MHARSVNLEPLNRQFVAAMKAISKGRCNPQTVQFLKGGVTDDIRHVEPSVEQVATFIEPALADGITDTDALARIVRRSIGFFISGVLIAKARNLIDHRRRLKAKASHFTPVMEAQHEPTQQLA